MLALTPEMLESAYEFLRTTQPFNEWALPHADEVEFVVNRHQAWLGSFGVSASGTPQIAISDHCVGHVDTLCRAMAHEMIHLQQWATSETNKSKHNAAFRERAKLVCFHHGWDLKVFV